MMHSVSQVFGRMFQIFLMFGQKCCALDLVDSFRAIQQTLHIYMTGILPQKGDFFFKEQVKTVDSFRAIKQTLHIYMTGILPQKGDFFFLKSK